MKYKPLPISRSDFFVKTLILSTVCYMFLAGDKFCHSHHAGNLPLSSTLGTGNEVSNFYADFSKKLDQFAVEYIFSVTLNGSNFLVKNLIF